MLQVPTGKIHQAKTSQGIQKEGYHKGGMLVFFFFFWGGGGGGGEGGITFVSIILLKNIWTGCLQFKIICRSQKSQFHHMKNEKRKFGFPNEQKRKGMWFYTLLQDSV
jgi:hypothetical protein